MKLNQLIGRIGKSLCLLAMFGLLQVDFSENASISHENKIQSAHWSHQQVTVFTSHVWVDNNEKESYAIIFDNLEHTKVAAYTFMTELFGDIMQIIHQLTWSMCLPMDLPPNSNNTTYFPI